MAQRIGAQSAFPEDLGFIPSTYMMVHNCFLTPVPRDWIPPFGLWGFCIHAVHRQICRQNSYTSKVNGSQKMKSKG